MPVCAARAPLFVWHSDKDAAELRDWLAVWKANELLAVGDLPLGAAIGLPTFEFEGATLYKRVTLILEAGRIAKVFYPVFPPDRNAEEVLAWLAS